jgi:hypothetical protein
MKRPTRVLPAHVLLGARFQHVCKCEVPTPGEYIVERVGENRKIAWLRNTLSERAAVARACDFERSFGERFELIAKG